MKKQQQDAVTLVRWAGKPSNEPLIKFATFSVIGTVLCLALMIFIPWFRNLGISALFVGAFATILTVPVLTTQRSRMRGVTERINEALAELTAGSGEKLAVKDVRFLMASGKRRPLSIDGAPGLCLQVKRIPSVVVDSPDNWRAVVCTMPLRIGTASFDRLLAAALKD
ncbi:MAG TPA: hypothetical protein VJP90_07285 [Paenarthrobacter sp.]|nr:hypothetical protein [Paenarthrobacter sp.]